MTTANLESVQTSAEAGTDMALKRILVHFDQSQQGQSRMDLAVTLARQFGSRLTGVHVIPTLIPPAFVVGQVPPAFLVEQERDVQEAAEAARRQFIERASKEGLTADWQSLQFSPVVELRRLARYADLAIVGQNDPDARDLVNQVRPEDVVLGSGRPVLVVPYIGAPATTGRRVVIAWNGGREAARAVGDALPLLRRAETVWALSIGRDAGETATSPTSELARFLADHGIRATPRELIAGDDISASDLLLSMLSDLGADLLVMGCYGHSRMREVVLGGMTRGILRHMTVPVLMSH
jgi:nucleotide-binding universal stress UspA family protein